MDQRAICDIQTEIKIKAMIERRFDDIDTSLEDISSTLSTVHGDMASSEELENLSVAVSCIEDEVTSSRQDVISNIGDVVTDLGEHIESLHRRLRRRITPVASMLTGVDSSVQITIPEQIRSARQQIIASIQNQLIPLQEDITNTINGVFFVYIKLEEKLGSILSKIESSADTTHQNIFAGIQNELASLVEGTSSISRGLSTLQPAVSALPQNVSTDMKSQLGPLASDLRLISRELGQYQMELGEIKTLIHNLTGSVDTFPNLVRSSVEEMLRSVQDVHSEFGPLRRSVADVQYRGTSALLPWIARLCSF